jgi:cytochrome c peroxidase
LLSAGSVALLAAGGLALLGGVPGCGDGETTAPGPTTTAGPGPGPGGQGGVGPGGQGGVGPGGQGGVGPGGQGGGGAPPIVALRPSKSSTIAITEDDSLVAMVNPEDDSVAVFDVTADTRIQKHTTGDEPSAVAIHPDGTTLYVANQADATVVALKGFDGAAPTVTKVNVGSEPTGLALSPTGKFLYVAEWAEGRITQISTADMTILKSVELVGTDGDRRHPRAVSVTSNGDESDDDELVVVADFFGEPVDGDPVAPGVQSEANDKGRAGKVHVLKADLSPSKVITLSTFDSGFLDSQATPQPVSTSPNQLYNAWIQGSRIYVPSVSASPQPPVKNNTNVYPVVYVGDLMAGAEVITKDAEKAGTTNLAKLVAAEKVKMNCSAAGKPGCLFLAEIVDMAFVGDATSNISYVVSRGADAVQRVTWDAGAGVSIGSPQNLQIDVNVDAPGGSKKKCQNPTGIVTPHQGGRGYLNCWVTQQLGILDFTTQSLAITLAATDNVAAPGPVEKGRRFYFTGRGRWSAEGWSSCGSCHPAGLSDNITWIFPAGPRQTTSMDGTFSHGSTQKMRILNWTGIFEELHDFERNTRGVSGGLGAITQPKAGQMCGNAANEDPIGIATVGNLGQPMKDLNDNTAGSCKHTDWDDITEFTKTIRPPKAAQFPVGDPVKGAAIFGEGGGTDKGGCVRCHGGAGWTVSRRFWTPKDATKNGDIANQSFPGVKKFPNGWGFMNPHWNLRTAQIQTEIVTAIGPAQVACVLRDIDTFGDGGPGNTDTLGIEKKDAATSPKAQGEFGYNVPSLYGLALGAPYLHHGQAKTLKALLTDTKWSTHLKAGNPNFTPTAQQIDDLIAFLLTIDAKTPEMQVPKDLAGDSFDVCPDADPFP